MRLKSFYGKTLADAMAQVRAALGDDAIIIATRDADDGGVQVTAALDENPTPVAPPAPTADLMSPLTDGLMEDDIMDAIADALQRHGTPLTLSETIMAHAARNASGDGAATLASGLADTLTFSDMPDTKAKTILLIGPPGAGKTAMIGKLAARGALAGKKIAAISTDLERAGGVAQLAAYTESLKIPLMEVEDAAALRDAMNMIGDVDLLFVDSTGINPFDPKAAAHITNIVKQADAVNILVLPAGMEAMDAGELASAFKGLGATHILPTRLDITRRLGSLLSVAAESRLALCAASATPTIGGGLEILTPQSLAMRLLSQPNSAPLQQTSTTKTATYGKR